MFRKGTRLFGVATLLLFVVAALHTVGVVSEPPSDPATTDLLATMDAYRADVGLGMRPSILDIQKSLALTMTLLLVLVGVQNLVVLRAPAAGLVRRAALVSALGAWGLTVLYWHYRVAPPLVCFAVLAVLFSLAWVGTRSASMPPTVD